jgi:hypothetical protein
MMTFSTFDVSTHQNWHGALCQRQLAAAAATLGCWLPNGGWSGLHRRFLIEHPKQYDEEIHADGADQGPCEQGLQWNEAQAAVSCQ